MTRLSPIFSPSRLRVTKPSPLEGEGYAALASQMPRRSWMRGIEPADIRTPHPLRLSLELHSMQVSRPLPQGERAFTGALEVGL